MAERYTPTFVETFTSNINFLPSSLYESACDSVNKHYSWFALIQSLSKHYSWFTCGRVMSKSSCCASCACIYITYWVPRSQACLLEHPVLDLGLLDITCQTKSVYIVCWCGNRPIPAPYQVFTICCKSPSLYNPIYYHIYTNLHGFY